MGYVGGIVTSSICNMRKVESATDKKLAICSNLQNHCYPKVSIEALILNWRVQKNNWTGKHPLQLIEFIPKKWLRFPGMFTIFTCTDCELALDEKVNTLEDNIS